MQYVNIKVPLETAWLDTDEDIFAMLKAITGKECKPVGKPLNYNASIGRSSHGPYVEGDIDYTVDGLGYSLAYDFMHVDDTTARIFRTEISRQTCFDVSIHAPHTRGDQRFCM
jgi:hypothetical protein